MPLPKNLQLFLSLNWKIAKLYDNYLNQAAPSYGLTRNEKDVLLFLHNNFPLDTAGDVVKYRSISKSLVAKSVASLTERGFLKQIPDQQDGRFVHLQITAAARPLVAELRAAQDRFFAVIESSLSPEDKERLRSIVSNITEQIDRFL